MIIRNAEIEDIPKLIDLANLSSDYNWKDEWYKWQCFDNPLPSVFLVAEANNELVGMFGLQVKQLRSNQIYDETIQIGQIVWLNFTEEWKAQGLFREMGQQVIARFDNLDGLCIVSNKKNLEDCKEGLGLRNLGVLNRLNLNPQNINIKEDSAICEEVDSNTRYETIERKYKAFLFEKENDFRVWRFSNSPGYNYFKVTIPTGEYAIVKLFYDFHPNSPKDCIGDIVDFECDINNKEKLKMVFSSAINNLVKMGSIKITTWANPSSVLRNVLGRVGFVEGANNGFFGFKLLNSQFSMLTEYEKWHLVQSDATNY